MRNAFSACATVALGLAFSAPVADAQTAKTPPRAMAYDKTSLDNAYVTVSRDSAPCAQAEAKRCEDRVILAMADGVEVKSAGRSRKLKRGQIAVFKPGESYDVPTGGPFYEVVIKPGHPPVKSPPEHIPPPKNVIVHENAKFFVYLEVLAVGDTRPRHTHSQRVEIRLSNGPMLHQWVWNGDKVTESEPSRVNWREPMIHEVRNIGDAPLRNFILEFVPQK